MSISYNRKPQSVHIPKIILDSEIVVGIRDPSILFRPSYKSDFGIRSAYGENT